MPKRKRYIVMKNKTYDELINEVLPQILKRPYDKNKTPKLIERFVKYARQRLEIEEKTGGQNQ